jgi:hypothetical protein
VQPTIPTPGTESAHCACCGQAIEGEFCSACGEEVPGHHDLSIRHFLTHTVLHEFIHVDGKVSRTFRYLLSRPGFLACEYFRGRKGLYLNPLRVLITASVLFALLSPGSVSTMDINIGNGPHPFRLRLNMLPPSSSEHGSIDERIGRLDIGNILSSEWAAVKRRHRVNEEEAGEKFGRLVEGYGEILSFCSVIPLALGLWALYGRRRRYLVEHLVFSMHLESFLLLLGIAVNSVAKYAHISSSSKWIVPFVLTMVAFTYLPQVWYFQSGLPRFYEPDKFALRYRITSWTAWKTAFAGLALFLLNSLFLSVVHIVGAAVALWRL